MKLPPSSTGWLIYLTQPRHLPEDDQELWWAGGYNIVAIPLAGCLIAMWGLLINPAVGAVLMSVSTVVALNSQLLKRAGSL